VSSKTQMMTIPSQNDAPAALESDWIKRMNSQ
jgi:hypothetical protein